jgi:UDP-glucose 4-epimerase
MSERRILISGGAGFVGYHLALKISQDLLDEVVIVDNFARGRLDAELQALVSRPNVRLLSGDLTEASTYDQLGGSYDEVYHLAAIIGVENVLKSPHEVVRVNATTTLLLLDWFVKGGGEKLFFSSTSEAYAWTQKFYRLPVPTPEDIPLALVELGNPRSSYAATKIFGELAVTQFCNMFEKPFVIARYHNVYGPRMGHEHVIPQVYKRILEGQNPLEVYSSDHTRAFCYISDAVAATIQAMRSPAADGRTINIGNDLEEITMAELAKRLVSKANMSLEIAHKPAAHDHIARRCPDISRARELLGYQPIVALDEGLDLTLAWYKPRLDERSRFPKS